MIDDLWFLIVTDANGVSQIIGAALDEATCYAAMISSTPHALMPWVFEAMCFPVSPSGVGA